jgi:hypothetical protein
VDVSDGTCVLGRQGTSTTPMGDGSQRHGTVPLHESPWAVSRQSGYASEMVRWKRRSRDPIDELFKRAVDLCVMDLPDETEHSIASGPGMVLGVQTFEELSSGIRTLALTECRMGFMVRAAETQVVPEANDPEDQGWLTILEVYLKSCERFGVDPKPAGAMIAAAEWFSRDLETTGALFQSVPGLAPEARRGVMARSLAPDNSLRVPEQDRLFVYGFALGSLLEVALVSQERGDAEREGREPTF